MILKFYCKETTFIWIFLSETVNFANNFHNYTFHKSGWENFSAFAFLKHLNLREGKKKVLKCAVACLSVLLHSVHCVPGVYFNALIAWFW
jgi:hypothetical protein